MFISVTFRIVSFHTLPFIPQKKICIEFSANDSKLSFMDHINDKVNKAYSILGIIKRNFIHLDINSLFYCIRLWLDHIWNMQILSGAYIRKATEIIEKV